MGGFVAEPESVTGYLLRLAWYNRLSPGRLLGDVAPRALRAHGLRGEAVAAWLRQVGYFSRAKSGGLLVPGRGGRALVELLELLTLRDGLGVLALHSYADVLGPHGLIRPRLAFCVRCLAEWAAAGLPAYEPLLWQFQALEVCPRHGMALAQCCPNCGATRAILTASAVPGRCGRCGLKYHRSAQVALPSIDPERLGWGIWVGQELGALVASLPGMVIPPTGLATPRAVRLAVERAGSGALSRLAERAGLAVATLSLWQDGRRQPAFGAALRICRVAGFTLVAFLTGDLGIARGGPASEWADLGAAGGDAPRYRLGGRGGVPRCGAAGGRAAFACGGPAGLRR